MGGDTSPPDGSGTSSWYAIRVNARHEKRVAQLLAGAEFQVYLPLVRTLRQWSDRRKMVEVPLFPGYLFVHCAMDGPNRVRLLSASRSVLAIVGSGPRPVPIPSIEIESIRSLLQADTQVTTLARLVRGARVRVMDGPLAGVEGVVVSRRGGRRIVCSVKLLGRSVRADLEAGNVTAVA